MEIPELYFKRDVEWHAWLKENHNTHKAVHLVFYKLDTKTPTMRWEAAVKVALCFGWIDSTVKSLGKGKRIQYFSPRNHKSVWSALNKKYIIELNDAGLMQESGLEIIKITKANGSWTLLDNVENGIIPENLQKAFDKNPDAFTNYLSFSKSYRKNYLYWLNQAKREATKQKRITEIIRLCKANIKSRNTW